MRDSPRLPVQTRLPVRASSLLGVVGILARDCHARAAIVRHDEQAVVKNGRGAETVPAVKLDFAIGPRHRAIEPHRRHAAVVENTIDPLAIGAGGGRGKGVLALFARRDLLEHLGVPQDVPGLAVKTKDVAFDAAFARRRQKYPITPDNRR
jgi:hypothetical protein